MKSDVFILTVNKHRKDAWLSVVPTAKIIESSYLDDATMESILKQTLTKYFFVIRGEVSPECGIDLSYEPDSASKKYVHVWGDNDAIRLYNRRGVKKNPKNFTDEGLRNSLCELKFIEMDDGFQIIEDGWRWFETEYLGLEHCDKAFFFVKDPLVDLIDGFDTNFIPTMWNNNKIHAFQRLNPINNQVIDNGGVKLYPTVRDDDDVVNEGIFSCVEREYPIIKAVDINHPIEVDEYMGDTRFVWVVDQYLDFSDFEFDFYPTLFDEEVLHIWRTDFGVPSVKLVPLDIDNPETKEMKEPIGKLPQFNTYTSLDEGYEQCDEPFFWVVEEGGKIYNDFRREFYAKEVQDNDFWWKSAEWSEDKITCFKTLDLDGRPYSVEGILFAPNDPSKTERYYEDQLAGVSPHKKILPDIVFLSYDEEYADENYARLLARYPDAKRVHGVKGIFEAHKKAAEIVTTKRFFLVDADAIILDDFDMFDSLEPLKDYPDDAVFVWRSRNPVNGLEYGYGGLKCFSRESMLNAKNWIIDFSTSLSKFFVPVQEVSNITAFNTSKFNAWRGAFRECVKLSSKVIRNQKTDESEQRLEAWCTINNDPLYGEYVIEGAKAGREYGTRYSDHVRMLNKINDFSWLKDHYENCVWKDLSIKLRNVSFNGLILNNMMRIFEMTDVNISDVLSKGQLLSKGWMVENFPFDKLPESPNIFLCAGWHAMHGALISEKLTGDYHITSIDIDPSCERMATTMNANDVLDGKFKAITADIKYVNYSDANVVINTSCEHVEDIDEWYDAIPEGCVVVLQSNNYHTIKDHINCVESEDELLSSCPMSECLFKGSLELPDYTRFMVIGIK